MDTVRTPDDRFTDLPGYPFEPHYAEIPDGDSGTLRVHYLDEGRSNGSFVEIVDPQRATVAIRYFGVVRFKWVTGQIGKSVIGCSNGVHISVFLWV